jgi:hypothetical protein
VALAAGCARQAPAVRRTYPVQAVAITQTRGAAFIHGDVRSENESRGSTKTKESDSFFEEGIDYSLKGYIYHPNLVSLDAQFRLGLTQQSVDINGDSRDTNGNLLGYAITALLLQQKPVSVRLAASNSDEFLQRSFARTNEYKTQRQAIEIISRYLVSSSLLYENLHSDEISDQRETKRHTRRLRLALESRTNPNALLSLIYEHEDTAQTATFIPPSGPPVVQDQPTKRDEVNFSDVFHFGPKDLQDTLSGRARYLNRKGFFPDEVITVDQRLDLAHTPTFSSFYHALYDSETTQEEKDRLLLAEAGVLKKFYSSLDLGGRISVSSRDFGTGTEDITGAFVNANYRKHTDIGLFQSSLDLGREWEKQTSTSGVRPVINESVTLSGITFVALAQLHVLPGTIVVRTSDLFHLPRGHRLRGADHRRHHEHSAPWGRPHRRSGDGPGLLLRPLRPIRHLHAHAGLLDEPARPEVAARVALRRVPPARRGADRRHRPRQPGPHSRHRTGRRVPLQGPERCRRA